MSFLKRFQTSLESLHEPSAYKNHDTKKYVVAYSGGVDSLVLLHCFKKINATARAAHVHHGLQAVADDWVTHCQQTCKQLNIPLDILYVDAKQKSGESPEESARNARYQALQNNLTEDEYLVTAQHLNDQAETLLLQLFRSAGSAGLSAMPASKKIGEHVHLRPLLSFSRNEIECFAKENNLQWVEDPSNNDVSFDRNFLRKNIFPQLKKRWPEVTTQLSNVASLQSNNLDVLEDMAAIDLASAITTQKNQLSICVFEVMSMLSIERLQQLSSPRLLNLLRYWLITTLNKKPTRNLLEEIEKSLINSQADANPDIVFFGYAFRKFQGKLYLLKINNVPTTESSQEWNPISLLKLPDLNLQLKAVMTVGEGLNKKLLDESLIVSFRKGGEKFHPAGRRHSQSLKKLLQEASVPPWERDVVPLVYFGDELIAVTGLWVSREFSMGEGESGWVVEIEKL
ncbi:tRNA(Ile)-lysidine synthetase [hydrothermal vent metagenome]|uniref:tRNA(Ile)-lysidine synthetase n=1 Tax=hydrothermal vent metagenome TaxID=652676 RepID=A0A3B0W9C7_9ZZZZ